jgi:hypothetical protein
MLIVTAGMDLPPVARPLPVASARIPSLRGSCLEVECDRPGRAISKTLNWGTDPRRRYRYRKEPFRGSVSLDRVDASRATWDTICPGEEVKEGEMKVAEVFSLGGGGCDCGCGCYNEHAYYHGHFGHYDYGSYGFYNYGAYDSHGFHYFRAYDGGRH